MALRDKLWHATRGMTWYLTLKVLNNWTARDLSGDTLYLRITNADDTSTILLTLTSPTDITITGTGTALATVGPATTGDFSAGDYFLHAWVVIGSQNHELDRGTLRVVEGAA